MAIKFLLFLVKMLPCSFYYKRKEKTPHFLCDITPFGSNFSNSWILCTQSILQRLIYGIINKIVNNRFQTIYKL